MSKGSMFWSQATGKVGDVVIAINKGQTITRKYQKNVTNPKTRAQMLQRARFANAVKFYKRAYANFFKFAYEDKKQTESEYNAFMRHNTNTTSSILKRNQVSGTFPAVGNGWQVSAGSLAEAQLQDLTSSLPYLSLPSLNQSGAIATIAEISDALINDYALIEGDIITIVVIDGRVKTLMQSNPDLYPKWNIYQFIVNTADVRSINTINTDFTSATGKGLYIDMNSETSAKWYGVIYSRKSANVTLKVSDGYLFGNLSAQSMYNDATAENWLNAALLTWDVAPDAVLEGALVESSNTAIIETCSGDAIPRVSDTTFNTGVTSSAVLQGSNMSALKVSDFTGYGVNVKELVINSDSQATITLIGLGNHPTSWTLSYKGTLIAKHSTAVASITKVTPSSVNVIDAGDSVSLEVTGQNIDSLDIANIVISDDALSVTSFAATSATTGNLVLTASQQVTSASVSYNSKVIFEVKEVTITIDTANLPVNLSSGKNTNVSLTGEGLDTLNASSFVATGATIVSYTASSSTAATLVANVSTSVSYGEIKYGNIVVAKYEEA